MLNLREVIDIDLLQRIQDSFGEATGLAVVTVDFRGIPITKYSNFSKFCNLIREESYLREKCYQCDAFGGLEGARKDKPYIYRCHTGLVDFAIPISVKGQFVGSVLAGQVKLDEHEISRLEYITPGSTEWQQDEKIMESFNEISVIKFEKISSAAKMMSLVINDMVEKDVIRRIYEELNVKTLNLIEQMETRDLINEELKEKERNALQPLINPHFILNTLNTVSRLTIIENANRTQNIVFVLAEYLQYTLQNINKLVMLKDEISQIDRYLRIQRERYGDRIRSEIRIAADVEKTRIPSLILQAIVDNAIVHGLEPKEEGGMVQIHAYSSNEFTMIEVKDDGIGMTHDQYENALAEDNCKKNQAKGISISTVNMFLRDHFGDGHQLEIIHNQLNGTTVIFKLPTIQRSVTYVENTFSG